MKKYRAIINYTQSFDGEFIREEYEKYINSLDEIKDIEEALYSDYHVISVSVTVVVERDEEND